MRYFETGGDRGRYFWKGALDNFPFISLRFELCNGYYLIVVNFRFCTYIDNGELGVIYIDFFDKNETMKNCLKWNLIFLLVLSISLSLLGQQNFEIVLETDFDGSVVRGSKEQLIKKIREGKPIRIGWQLDFDKDNKPDFDHWMDAEFITILNNEVFTQIKNINLQSPNLEESQINIIPANTMWTGILGTNGLLKNRFVYDELEYEVDENNIPIITDQLEKELARREVKTWKVATFWVVEN